MVKTKKMSTKILTFFMKKFNFFLKKTCFYKRYISPIVETFSKKYFQKKKRIKFFHQKVKFLVEMFFSFHHNSSGYFLEVSKKVPFPPYYRQFWQNPILIEENIFRRFSTTFWYEKRLYYGEIDWEVYLHKLSGGQKKKLSFYDW